MVGTSSTSRFTFEFCSSCQSNIKQLCNRFVFMGFMRSSMLDVTRGNHTKVSHDCGARPCWLGKCQGSDVYGMPFPCLIPVRTIGRNAPTLTTH